LFRKTIFGPFLDLVKYSNQCQLIHELLFHVVHNPNQNELWFKFGDSFSKFSIEEFAVISGLKCTGDVNFSNYVDTSDFSRRSKYFQDHCTGLVKRGTVKKCFESVYFDSDEEAVKMGLLYFVSLFLLAKPKDMGVSDDLVRIVDSPRFNDFPWGKLSFNLLFASLKSGIDTLYKHDDKVLVRNDKRRVDGYKIYGLAFAFQVWAYECLPHIGGICAMKKFIDEPVPRIFKWSTDENYSKKPFDVLKSKDGQVRHLSYIFFFIVNFHVLLFLLIYFCLVSVLMF